MEVNRRCQVCRRNPREISVIFDSNIWLLCKNCGLDPSSKFSYGRVVDLPLNQLFIRDIFADHAFRFRGAGNGSHAEYMWVPNMVRNYSNLEVLNILTGKTCLIGWDSAVELPVAAQKYYTDLVYEETSG